MSADVYLQQILNRESVDTGIFSPVRTVQATLEPAIRLWANRFLIGISPSGSFAKGTANKSGTDSHGSRLPDGRRRRARNSHSSGSAPGTAS